MTNAYARITASAFGAALILGASACHAPRFTPADAANPNATPACIGKLVGIERDTEAKIYVTLHLEPEIAFRHLLPKGQTTLPCSIFADDKGTFEKLVREFEIGQRIEVHGYFVHDGEKRRHALRPVTSVDPFPDPK